MKRLLFTGCLSLALASGALAGPLTGYTNFGTLTSASLVLDYTNIVNLGIFDITGLTSFGQFSFEDVQTYSNRNIMFCDQGFLFDNFPASFGKEGPSVNFINQNPGQVYGGAVVLPPTSPISGTSGSFPQIIISATNIMSSGVLQVGQNGRIAAMGGALNLSHGSAIVESFEQNAGGQISGGTVLPPGAIIQYWGTGLESNNFTLQNLMVGSESTASAQITSSGYVITRNFSFPVPNAKAIAFTNLLSPSNIVTQVIIYGDSQGLVQESAYFLPIASFTATNNFQTAIVRWGVQITNAFGQVVSNTLFLTDSYASLPTNVTFVTNNTTLGGLPQLVPTNYTLTVTGPRNLNNTGNATYSTSLFNNGFGTNGNGIGLITNIYATFEANFVPVTVEPDSTVAGSTFSNLPGRLEITANQSLDLTGAIIDAGNFLNLNSPNDYKGSQGAQIIFPYADINLGSSNGQMTISNLVVPFVGRFNGPIQAWTGAWTNLTSATQIIAGTNGPTTNTFTVTNSFLVTMVASSLDPISPVNVQNLALRSTNLVISDALTVNNSMLINAQNLTISSNDPSDFNPTGQLVFFPADGSYLFSANLPVMQNFTNEGIVETLNAAYFQFRQNQLFPTPGDGPWQSIVNGGSIVSADGGTAFWANLFENFGIVEAGFGPITVQSSTALATNGFMAALDGDMSITSGNLTINSTLLEAAGFLNLAATNLLTDLTPPGNAGSTSGNFWSSGDGFSLLTAPASATNGLLGTSVTSACRTNAQCENFWAGIPVTLPAPGALPTMANNVPIGQLMLDGGNNNSVFHFQGYLAGQPDPVNPHAMYVDQIVLLDGATNFAGGKFTAFNVDPNMTIYFLKASSGATDISAQLNTNVVAGGGHLTWLSNYVGHFSVTHVTYADGETFAVNSAYVQNYGLPPEPPVVLTPQTILLNIGATNVASTPMASISWYSPAFSTNTLYYRTLTNPNWLVRTNFIQGATSGRVSCLDSLGTSHLYRVSVAPSP